MDGRERYQRYRKISRNWAQVFIFVMEPRRGSLSRSHYLYVRRSLLPSEVSQYPRDSYCLRTFTQRTYQALLITPSVLRLIYTRNITKILNDPSGDRICPSMALLRSSGFSRKPLPSPNFSHRSAFARQVAARFKQS